MRPRRGYASYMHLAQALLALLARADSQRHSLSSSRSRSCVKVSHQRELSGSRIIYTSSKRSSS